MPDNSQEKPKIIVDDDWKAQARAEKEKLSEQTGRQETGAEGGKAGAGSGALPPASFSVLVSSMLTQIFFALGAIEDTQTKKRHVDLAMAKHQIDMLAVLEEKTRGNLSEEEKKLLDRAIYEARMQYVQTSQHVGAAH